MRVLSRLLHKYEESKKIDKHPYMKVKGNVFKKAKEKTLSNHFETTCERTKRARKESLLRGRNVQHGIEMRTALRDLDVDAYDDQCGYQAHDGIHDHCTAIEFFENVRNFLMVVKELKLLAFDASDLKTLLKHTMGGSKLMEEPELVSALKSPLLSNSRRKNFSRPLKKRRRSKLKAVASVDEAINTLGEALLGYGGNDVGIR
ncbi:hypothetical protein Dimus_011814 [Dionaea muscipula]